MLRPATLALLVLLAGCATPPPPAGAPELPPLPSLAPAGRARVEAGLEIDRWWTLFGDPSLDAAVTRALANNHDLAIAAARLREARARLDEAAAARRPTLGLQLQNARARSSADGVPTAGATLPRSRHQALLAGDFDVDLWGRLAAGDAAARAQWRSAAWARAAVEWGLTAQVAEAHFSLRALARQLQISEAVRAGRAQTLALREREHAVGAGSEFELRRAQAELAATETTLVALQRQQVALAGTLALLVGEAPSALGSATAWPALDPEAPFEPRLPALSAAEALQRRPDLRQAEASWAASQAELAAARAATLPALRLSGRLGSDAQSLSNLFGASGFVWSLAASVTHSLVDGGAADARVEQARSRGDAAGAAYRRAVLAALIELRDAYAALDLDVQARESQRARVLSLERARALAQRGVDAGALPRIDLLDAERNAYQARLDEVAAYRDQLIGHVAVLKALGGGHGAVPGSKTFQGDPA